MPPPGASSFEGLLSDRQVEADREIGRELAQKSLESKFNFTLSDTGNIGARFRNNPFDINVGFTQGSRIGPWGITLDPEEQPDWLNARVGVQGHGTSGQVSPWGNLSVSPFEGVNFNVTGRRFPGTNFNLMSPSVSYQGQFKHPLDKWTGPLNVSAEKRLGQQPTGMLSVRRDF